VGKVDDCGRLDTAGAAVKQRIKRRTQARLNVVGIVQRQLVARQHQGRAHDGLAQLFEQQLRHRVIRNPNPDGAALLVLQPTRRLTGCLEQEGIRPRCRGLEQAKLWGIYFRVLGDLGQIPAYEGEVMMPVGLSDSPDSFERILIADVAPEGIARVGWIGDDPTPTQEIGRLLDKAPLRIFRMQFESQHDGRYHTRMDRLELLRSRLQTALEPELLELRDDSALHAGHAGAREGGHFHVTIASARFAGISPLKRHQLVYAAVGDLFGSGVHALSIDARLPS